MGLDIYLKWDDMTEEDAKAQITGFNINSGHKGYLRASYNETMCVELGLLHKVFENKWNDKGKNVPLKVSQDRIQEVIKLLKNISWKRRNREKLLAELCGEIP